MEKKVGEDKPEQVWNVDETGVFLSYGEATKKERYETYYHMYIAKAAKLVIF